ncbi:MAG: hypothetical protein ACTSWN_05970 [Promethearchaeota archaeon]
MKSLIMFPLEEKSLKDIAFIVAKAIKKNFFGAKVNVITIAELNSPDYFFDNDIIIIGTPCIRNDICWPIQIKIDGIIHKVLKKDFSRKIITAFSLTKEKSDAHRCIKALLWTFNETNAKVIDGISILEEFNEKQINEEIERFIKELKKLMKR